MQLNTRKGGASRLFKQEVSQRLNQETAILVYREDGAVKTATFRNADCTWRAKQRAAQLRQQGAQIISITGGTTNG